MEKVENRIVNNSVWENMEKDIVVSFKGAGREEIGTGIFVPEKSAFDYAMERILGGTDNEKQKFVEWFYSGNWIKKEDWGI